MLTTVIIFSFLQSIVWCAEKSVVKEVKPYVQFPVPLELPFRNERADQCWLRVEDVELIDTVAILCTIAHAFLGNYIHEYNSRKMTEDAVDVSLWIEKPRDPEEIIIPPENNPHSIKDWRVTTLMDPIVHRRLYVSKNADCRIIMYSREAVSNYQVECENILYYLNVRSASAVFPYEQNLRLLLASLFLVYLLRSRV